MSLTKSHLKVHHCGLNQEVVGKTKCFLHSDCKLDGNTDAFQTSLSFLCAAIIEPSRNQHQLAQIVSTLRYYSGCVTIMEKLSYKK